MSKAAKLSNYDYYRKKAKQANELYKRYMKLAAKEAMLLASELVKEKG